MPFEWMARVTAFALLAVALWRAGNAMVGDAVPRVHAVFDDGVSAQTRDSLAALARAGVRVTWSGDLTSVAAMAEPVREPAAGWRVSVVATGASAVADSLGALDSLDAGGGTLTAVGVRGALSVREGSTTARTRHADDVSLGRVLVLSRAGWEAKFVIAALEEQGWLVDARLRVGPEVVVTQGGATGQGRMAVPSLARHAAVVVLDTAVGRDAAAIRRYVNAGGGLVLAGEGASAPSLQSIAPARVARVEPPESRSFEGNQPMHALTLHALGIFRRDAVLLEDRDGTPATAARRVGAGRVVQMGYADTWRWRMQGEGPGVAEHRAYWSRLVGAAAAAELVPPPETPRANAAPLALAIQALGPGTQAPPRAARDPRVPTLPRWLGPLILAVLVGEWASRRARGAL